MSSESSDPRSGQLLCRLYPQDKHRNAEGRRRRKEPLIQPPPSAAMESEEPVLLASAEPMPDAEVLRGAVAGNDEALRSLPRLTGTREEASSVTTVSDDVSLLLGPEASEQRLVQMADSGELSSFGTIHIATHALVDDERPERSALVLSQVDLPDPLEAAIAGERIYDGVVTARRRRRSPRARTRTNPSTTS